MKQDQYHEVALHTETLVLVTNAIVVTVSEVESGSTFCETHLSTQVQKGFMRQTTLHSATRAQTHFTALPYTSLS